MTWRPSDGGPVRRKPSSRHAQAERVARLERAFARAEEDMKRLRAEKEGRAS